MKKEEKWDEKKPREITRATNTDIEHTKKLLQICGTINISFFLATAAQNNKLPFLCSTLSKAFSVSRQIQSSNKTFST